VPWGSSGGEVPAAKRSAIVMPPSLQAGIHDVSHQESDVPRPARTWGYGADVRATAPAGGVVVVEYLALGTYEGGHGYNAVSMLRVDVSHGLPSEG
jgi:hypothetical protein